MKIYIASSLDNSKQVRALRDALIKDGHEITYDWTAHGSVQGEGEEVLLQVATNEILGVHDADFVIVILPGGRGTHVELGAANVLFKPVLLFSNNDKDFMYYEATCAFYWNANVMRLHSEGKAEEVIPGLLRKADAFSAMISKHQSRLAEHEKFLGGNRVIQ